MFFLELIDMYFVIVFADYYGVRRFIIIIIIVIENKFIWKSSL